MGTTLREIGGCDLLLLFRALRIPQNFSGVRCWLSPVVITHLRGKTNSAYTRGTGSFNNELLAGGYRDGGQLLQSIVPGRPHSARRSRPLAVRLRNITGRYATLCQTGQV